MAATEKQKAAQRKANLKPERKRYSREWQRIPENKRKADNIRLRHRYGITVDDRDALVAVQNGRCAICKLITKLHVDHDHSTGVVRGLLCGNCNRALGLVKENTATLVAMAVYVEEGGSCRI